MSRRNALRSTIILSRSLSSRFSNPTHAAVLTVAFNGSSHNRQRNFATQAQTLAEAQKFEFQAETKSLLDIVAKSLYSDQEVFIRELISNASDALEKRRCAELASGTADQCAVPYELHITTNPANRTITFKDSGIGMNREDLLTFLGTIAKSGSKSFREDAADKQSAESIIGQFGVGFYSAFVVSDKVTVITKKVGENVGFTWIWEGGSEYQVIENPDAETGTTIELLLRSGEAEKFAHADKVIEVINKYSMFITAPISVNGEHINTLKALWTMNASETTPEMHEAFFKQLAKTHYPHLLNDRPQYTFQYKTDSPIDIRALFYVPSHKVSQLEFAAHKDMQFGVSLYNRKVLIKSHCKELLPHYLRFLVGVVDSEDIPLNLSREMLQTDLIMEKIRDILTERIIKYFVTQQSKDRVKYNDFYTGYSLFFKEGIVVEQSHPVKENIAKLLLFESSNFKAKTYTTLQEYIDRMQADQQSIYYLYAPSRQLAESSPYYETFKSRNFEVLFVYDVTDELALISMPQFQMKKLESVEQWAKNEGLESEEDRKEVTRDASKRDFIDWIQQSLGSVKATAVKPSARPSEHPLVITVGADMGAARHLLRISEFKEMEHLVFLKPVVHINFSHPVVAGLMKLRKTDAELAKRVAEQVYDNALITAGLLKDSSQMVLRINQILGELMKGEKSPILTP